jgi:CTP synthase
LEISGICLGFQCAVIDFARNKLGIPEANSTEFRKDLKPEHQLVIDMPEHAGEKYGMGATMRLGKRTTVFLTNNCQLSG